MAAMFAVVQLPVTDLRPFETSGELARLRRPTWPVPVHGHEFVRRFGMVRQRTGDYRPWDAENYYCGAIRSLTFVRPPSREPVRMYPLFKNLFTNGVVARVEVGFRVETRHPEVAELAVSKLVVRVASGPGRNWTGPLVKSAGQVARLYAASTTPTRVAPEARRTDLVVPGTPLVLTSSRTGPVPTGSRYSVRIEPSWLPVEGGRVARWDTFHPPVENPDEVRAIRTHAMRLNSEFESFAAVVRACIRRVVEPDASAPLRDYLHDTAKFVILKPRYHALPQGELLRQLTNARIVLTEGEQNDLRAAFAKLNKGFTGLVMDAVTTSLQGPPNRSPGNTTFVVVNGSGGEVTIQGGDSYSVGAGAKVSGVVGRQNQVVGSVVGDHAGGDAAQLGELSKRLVELLEELAPTLDGDGEDLVELGKMVDEEANAEEPNRSRIGVVLKSITAMVKQVGTAAKPVAEVVEALRQLLG